MLPNFVLNGDREVAELARHLWDEFMETYAPSKVTMLLAFDDDKTWKGEMLVSVGGRIVNGWTDSEDYGELISDFLAVHGGRNLVVAHSHPDDDDLEPTDGDFTLLTKLRMLGDINGFALRGMLLLSEHEQGWVDVQVVDAPGQEPSAQLLEGMELLAKGIKGHPLYDPLMRFIAEAREVVAAEGMQVTEDRPRPAKPPKNVLELPPLHLPDPKKGLLN